MREETIAINKITEKKLKLILNL